MLLFTAGKVLTVADRSLGLQRLIRIVAVG